MRYRTFGSTGLKLSAVGLGGMPLSLLSSRPSEADAIEVIHHAVDCGVNFIDTADSYCMNSTEAGHNERLIGKAVGQLPADVREGVTIATKGGLVRPDGRWERDGRPEHLRAACEASLKALGVEQIAIYQYHRIDPNVPLAESIGELKRLRDEGKIAHAAVSNHSPAEMAEANKIVPIVSVQNQYSPRHRVPEQGASAGDPSKDPNTAGTLEATREMGMAFICWSPLDGMGNAKALGEKYPAVAKLAREMDASPHQVVLAWLLAKGEHVFVIPGASRKQSIGDSAKAGDLSLSSEQVSELDRAFD